jgi:arylsulfatase A-like enzyme
MKLVEFANIEVTPGVNGIGSILAKLREVFGNPPYTYWGTEVESDYSPDVTGKMTTRLLKRERSSRKPFFFWWSVAAPHREDVSTTLMGRTGPDPRSAPRFLDDVADLQLPRPPNFDEADMTDKSQNMQETAPPLTQAEIDQLTLDYQGRAGSLMAVDEHVGEMVKTLRKTGQLRNTVIMFLSDNGWMQGEHRIPGDKFLPYEESLRIPLIIRGPGIPKGQRIKGQVSNIDFAPTLVDMAGADAGRKLDGVSLLPTIADPSLRPDRALQIEAPAPLFAQPVPANEWDRPYTGVRTDRYTYVLWTETGELELYDRKTDPYQLQNVITDPAYAEVRARLARKLARLQTCAGASCNVAP